MCWSLSGARTWAGASLVYANTLLQPSDEFFSALIWKNLADWKSEPRASLSPRPGSMLGVTT